MNHGAGSCAEVADTRRRRGAKDARTSNSRSGEKPAPSNPAAKQSGWRTADNARTFPAACCTSSPTTRNRATAESGLSSAGGGSGANETAGNRHSRSVILPKTQTGGACPTRKRPPPKKVFAVLTQFCRKPKRVVLPQCESGLHPKRFCASRRNFDENAGRYGKASVAAGNQHSCSAIWQRSGDTFFR